MREKLRAKCRVGMGSTGDGLAQPIGATLQCSSQRYSQPRHRMQYLDGLHVDLGCELHHGCDARATAALWIVAAGCS